MNCVMHTKIIETIFTILHDTRRFVIMSEDISNIKNNFLKHGVSCLVCLDGKLVGFYNLIYSILLVG